MRIEEATGGAWCQFIHGEGPVRQWAPQRERRLRRGVVEFVSTAQFPPEREKKKAEINAVMVTPFAERGWWPLRGDVDINAVIVMSKLPSINARPDIFKE